MDRKTRDHVESVSFWEREILRQKREAEARGEVWQRPNQERLAAEAEIQRLESQLGFVGPNGEAYDPHDHSFRGNGVVGSNAKSAWTHPIGQPLRK